VVDKGGAAGARVPSGHGAAAGAHLQRGRGPAGARRPPARLGATRIAATGLLLGLIAALMLAVGLHFGLRVLLICVGAPSLLAGVYLLWQVDPAYTLTAGFLLSPFSGNWQYLHFPSGVDPDRILLTFGIVQVLLRAPHLRRRPQLRWMAAHLAMLLAVGYAAVSAYFAHTLFSKDPLFKLIDSYGVIPFLVFTTAPLAFRTARHRAMLLAALVAMGLYLGLTTVFETVHLNALVFPRYILNPHVGYHYGRGRGPFVDAVANGFALATCAIACVVAHSTWTGLRARALAVVVALLCVGGAFMSLERSVWLGAGCGILAAMALTRRLRRHLLPAIALGALVVSASLALIPSFSHSVSARATEVNPIWDRENLARAGLNMIEARPLTGFGWQTFQSDSRLYFQQSQNYPLTATTFVVHNFLLGYAVELGVIGLALWLAAVLLGVGSALGTRGPPDLEMWRVGLIAVAIMFAVVANSIPPSEFPNLALWLWAGVVLAGRYELKEQAQTVPVTPQSRNALPGRAAPARM